MCNHHFESISHHGTMIYTTHPSPNPSRFSNVPARQGFSYFYSETLITQNRANQYRELVLQFRVIQLGLMVLSWRCPLQFFQNKMGERHWFQFSSIVLKLGAKSILELGYFKMPEKNLSRALTAGVFWKLLHNPPFSPEQMVPRPQGSHV